MTYSIFARDGTSRIVLKRQSREAAEKKARELTELGWFDVQIAEQVEIEEAECSGKSLREPDESRRAFAAMRKSPAPRTGRMVRGSFPMR